MSLHSFYLTIGLALASDGHQVRRSFFSALQPCLEFNDIELLICDNSPDLNRDFILKNMQENVRYIANPTNIGAAENFNKIHEEANGDFVLILGDDDFLHPFFCEHWDFIKNEIKANPQRTIYSLPQFFNDSQAISTITPPKEFYDHIQSNQLSQRAAGIASLQTLNYFFYSIQPKKSISWQIGHYYIQKCPGYTRSFDWAVSYAPILFNPSLQLDKCYYVYNNRNWSSPDEFISREVNLFKADLKEELREKLSIRNIQTIRNAASAAMCCSYFLCLGIHQEKFNQIEFNAEEFYRAASLILKARFLNHIPLTQGDWQQLCNGSQKGLWETLSYVLNQVKGCYREELGEQLIEFLIETPKSFNGAIKYQL